MPEVDARKQRLAAARRKLLEKRLKGQAIVEEAIPVRQETGPAPLSLAQERFWFLHQLAPDDPTYNMHEAWAVVGPLDTAALAMAVNQVVARQPALRTTIGKVKGRLVQRVLDELVIDVPILDFSHLSDEQWREQRGALATAEARALFDLHKGPLIRFTILRRSADSHVILYTVHHIVSDENSNDIFWRELAHFYRLARAGEGTAASLGPLPVQYSDFAVWQRDWLARGERERQLTYWQKQLGDGSELLQLPLDEPRPARQSSRGGFCRRTFSPQLAAQVAALSQDSGATPFMIFMALFQMLLHRYSQQDDIWVGTPIANRGRREVQDLVGLFLNTIIIRNQFQPELSFRNLIELVKQSAFDAFAHQDLPFEQLVDELQPERDPAYHPLFQVMFVYSPAGALTRSLPGVELKAIPVDGGVAKFDLTLFVAADTEQIEAGFEYNADIFSVATVERMLSHLEIMLERVLADPHQLISRVSYLSDDELQQIASWNPEPELATSGPLLHQLIEERAASQPEATALQFKENQLSYAELNLAAERLAATLQSAGIQPGDFVGLFAERRPEMLIGILAILKAGAAYVPIDPEYPAERIQHIITDAALRIILSCGERALKVSVPGTQQLAIESLLNGVSSAPEQFRPVALTPESIAYLIYTSGSTGKPKGVMVSHANIVHSTTARFDFYERPVERFLLLSSFAFDSSLVGIFWSLCQGGTLVLPPAGMHQNVRYLLDTIARRQVTHLLALPSLYQILLEEGAAELASLKTVMVAGEACHAALVKFHYETLPHADLYNEYGPTEGTVWSHAYRFPRDFAGPAVPIGAPIPNMQGFVLDRNQQLVPVGVPGELILGGAGIAAGYLGQPELTAERFLALPGLSERPEARFYRTGDLVRWRPDGNLDFLGRFDQQVKIRGFRIELGEVETALRDHPGVQEAAVAVHDTGDENQPDRQLVAYYVPLEGLDEAALRRFLGAQLPNYMVPAHFVSLATMPYTANGKLNRRALPRPNAVALVEQERYEAPRDELEEMLVGQWQKLLGARQIGIHDNFFAFGGHSLLALRLFTRIEEVTGRKMLLSTLFEAPTVAQLAERIRDQETGRASASLVPIKPAGFKRPFFYVSPYTISILEFNHLGRYFDPERPFYGLQPSGLAEDEAIYQSIPEIAAHYIKAIRSVQPEGPYLIGGHCDGGWVAYEMAAQLAKMAEEVTFLALVDVPAPGYEEPHRNRWSRLKSRVAYYLKNRRFLFALSWKAKMQLQSWLIFRFGSPASRRIKAVREAHAAAHQHYVFRYDYEGPVHMILSSENLAIEQNMSWYGKWSEQYGQQVHYTHINSTHDRLLYDPDAIYLAEALLDGIANAEGGIE